MTGTRRAYRNRGLAKLVKNDSLHRARAAGYTDAYAGNDADNGTGELRGWYCDITRPAVLRNGKLLVEDLDLDLWVSADGALVLRLDEDEFEESGRAEHDPAAAGAARRALDELEALARADGLATLLA